jgi:hypothetical protein
LSTFPVDLVIPAETPVGDAMPQIDELLREKEVIQEYCI